jgi:hypothetical protein
VNGTLLIASSDALEALQLVQAILSKLVRRSRFCGGIAPPMLRMRRKRRSFHIAPALGLVKLKNHAPAHVHGLDRERLDSGLSPNCPVRAQDLAGAFPQFAGLWGARLEGFEPPTRGLGNRIGLFVGVSGG